MHNTKKGENWKTSGKKLKKLAMRKRGKRGLKKIRKFGPAKTKAPRIARWEFPPSCAFFASVPGTSLPFLLWNAYQTSNLVATLFRSCEWLKRGTHSKKNKFSIRKLHHSLFAVSSNAQTRSQETDVTVRVRIFFGPERNSSLEILLFPCFRVLCIILVIWQTKIKTSFHSFVKTHSSLNSISLQRYPIRFLDPCALWKQISVNFY